MKDEIKINTIGQLLDYVETEEKANQLIDYITNLQENARDQVNDYFKNKYADEVLKNAKLQEENERLEKRNIYYINNEKNLLSDWHQEHNEAIEYKSRNEKAIEFIKEKGCYYSGDFDDILDLNDLDDLLNILNGGDEE